MRTISMCSGIGGLDIGLKYATGATTVAYLEGEAFCAAVLQARMGEGLDEAPIWSDVKTFDAGSWRGVVDCITAGYPCQPFSAAGRRAGDRDPRHLWPHIARHIDTIRPAFVFCENVPGHLTLGFDQVCEDLSAMGYFVEAGIFSAEELGAPHRRERLFFLAHTDSERQLQPYRPLSEQRRRIGDSSQKSGLEPACATVADADYEGLERHRPSLFPTQKPMFERDGPMADADSARCGRHGLDCDGGRSAFPGLGESTSGHADMVDEAIARGWPDDWEDGVPRITTNKEFRVDRLRALGNAVVPAVAAHAWMTLYRQAGLP